MNPDWSPQQLSAIEHAEKWLSRGNEQVFRLFGYAGTGKTTITRRLVESVKGPIVYMAFTGKAASVMRKHGTPANTIHSTIYNLEQPDYAEYRRILKELKSASDNEKEGFRQKLAELRQPQFTINYDSIVSEAALVVLDEVSMVGEEDGKNLESFDVPILVLGDPGQLPPIRGAGYFTDATPDIMLTEVHRQAEDNPIINLATKARTGLKIDYGDYGASQVIRRYDWSPELAKETEQVLTGKNKTRRILNQKIRKLCGLEGDYPIVGDKLICLRNDKNKNIFNGLQGEVTRAGEEYDFSKDVQIKFDDGRKIDLQILRAHFDEYRQEGAYEEFTTHYPFWVRKGVCEFDYGYAITVHKSQGSQWDNVTLMDDGFGRDAKTRRRWLYTAITRAAEKITIVR